MNKKLIEEIRGLALEIMKSIDDYEDSLEEGQETECLTDYKIARKEIQDAIIEKIRESECRHIEIGYYDLDNEFVYLRLIVWDKDPEYVVDWIGNKFGYHGELKGKDKMYWKLWCRREDSDEEEIRVLVMKEKNHQHGEMKGYMY